MKGFVPSVRIGRFQNGVTLWVADQAISFRRLAAQVSAQILLPIGFLQWGLKYEENFLDCLNAGNPFCLFCQYA